MKPAAFRKLTATQNARLAEITLLSTRIREKARDVLNANIVRARLDAINKIWSEARECHSGIISQDAAETDLYVTNDTFTSLQTTYEDTLDYLLTLAADFEKETNEASRQQASVAISSAISRPAKLPKLDLPSYSGKYEDWDSFSDLFTSLVHNAPSVDDATKLQYLKSCLTGPAADLVKDVSTTSANYTSTWQALKVRFYNPRLTVANHLNALMNLPNIKRESASEMRNFADESQRIVRALTNLKMPINHWDVWLVHILSARLDPESRKLWESELSARDSIVAASPQSDNSDSVAPRFPTFAELATFLEKRSHALSMVNTDHKPDKRMNQFIKTFPGSRKVFHAGISRPHKGSIKCPLCSSSHSLAKCPTFIAKSPYERRLDVRHLRLCYNCLGRHNCRDCSSNRRCNACRDKDHSLLHFENKGRLQANPPSSDCNPRDESKESNSAGIKVHTLSASAPKYSVILATAQAFIVGPNSCQTRARLLLDQGSEGSFITETTAQLLGLKRERVNVPLTVVGGTSIKTARTKTNFIIRSRLDTSFEIEVQALVLPRLTSHIPARKLLEIHFKQFDHINLADPQFHVPDAVDVILGADVYGLLLRNGVQRFPPSHLVAQNTALGWIISGSICKLPSRRAETNCSGPLRTLYSAPAEDLNNILERFWVLEELPRSNVAIKPDDEICEKQFVDTHTRSADGRYIIHLPLKGNLPNVGSETRRMALGALKYTYRRFQRDPSLASDYRELMNNYEQLGHMSRIPEPERDNPRSWYLPHHAVSHNGKIRVVFDASRRTREQQCLNDFLLSGPPLQNDLSLILLNWRRYRFTFTADIVKMFRQIRVTPKDQNMQRIVWAPSEREQPVEYRLHTVTYGTTCALFLALRTLQQLAKDEKNRFPLGARCLNENTYVDDTFSGADNLSDTIKIREQLVEILQSAGIQLDKWAANNPDILPAHVALDKIVHPKSIDRDNAIKTLGVYWNTSADVFNFTAGHIDTLPETITKRNVLSNIARLFDPLGWLSPITIVAKILMQDLWILKSDWDSLLPEDARERWINYCRSLSALPTLSIPRWLGTSVNRLCQIHGFSDASSRAYAAVVYLRIEDSDGSARVGLLASKTKVAPMKSISIPNLELCGVTLLTKLAKHLRTLNFIKDLPLFMWSDSEIALKWLSKHPCTWKTFVANRVSQIQTELPAAKWAHVPTKENPADIATRGATPTELREHKIWWSGPSWLSLPAENWPQENWPQNLESVNVMHAHKQTTDEPELIARFSSLTRLIRVAAYCLRPILIMRRRKNGLNKLPNALTACELNEARAKLIRLAQSHAFAVELALLRAGKNLPKRNRLLKLNPIIGESDGILRVGGRLSQSNLLHERKHPPILPRCSNLSKLYIHHAHKIALHGGPTLTSSIVMKQVWIIGRTQLIRSIIRTCIKCQRVKPRLAHQLMGDLPASRVTPARPFTTTGVDYAGPFQIRTTKERGHRTYKGYIALFICFSTRAIHLEAVSDLTTASFLAAYRRFVSRRGICKHLYSDNATTFRAADKELRAMFNAASDFYQETAAALANDGTSWSYIPPTTPHYGGLWEAGVKSTKHHLNRAFGEHAFTFEEFSTILAEIESCLNSRPLCPLTNDVEDLNALTPAHFLIGQSTGLIPDAESPNIPESRLSRFQLMERIRNNFWTRWADEYLQYLQERTKWRSPTENFAIGQLVLLRDNRYPPAKWPLGRVVETHPGPDGHVRVVMVRTSSNTFRRHVTRLSPLFMEEDRSKET